MAAALLLQHLGHHAEAAEIERAVEADLAERGDLPARTTTEIGDAITVRVVSGSTASEHSAG
jgi:3-isopropylmalate dehydrogenase